MTYLRLVTEGEAFVHIRSITAIWIGRATKMILRALGRSGTSLPGMIAGHISPWLLEDLLKQLKRGVIVTGTNGKTTTTALLHAFLSTQGTWLTNRGGANLQQGLLATLLGACSLSGRLLVEQAVLEVDEATLPIVTRNYHPTLIVVTNVLRDQLDRYGEVDQALQMLQRGTRYEGTALLLNGDDPLAMSLGLERPELTYYYGFTEVPEESSMRDDVRDGAFCLICGAELFYDYFLYGQIGAYHCPNGHFNRPTPDFGGRYQQEKRILTVLEERPSRNVEFDLQSPVLGLFNQYNLLAAAGAARIIGVSPAALTEGIREFVAPIGRFQVFQGIPRRILALVKNPTGANSVLRAIEEDMTVKAICFAINDDDADGRDVSWLWDINLEEFIPRAKCTDWICTGTRGLDMALRLAYAGIERECIHVVDKLEQLVAATADKQVPVYVLSTYTALYPLSAILQEATSLA